MRLQTTFLKPVSTYVIEVLSKSGGDHLRHPPIFAEKEKKERVKIAVKLRKFLFSKLMRKKILSDQKNQKVGVMKNFSQKVKLGVGRNQK